jgi:hypothetical protein
MSDDQEIENEINEKHLNAPRINIETIEQAINKIQFYIFPDSCFTVCLLTLKNGFNVSGESACVSEENFDKELGEKIAFKNAKDKIWQLEGYLLKENLFNQR